MSLEALALGFRHFSKRLASLLPCTFKELENKKDPETAWGWRGKVGNEVPLAAQPLPLEGHSLRRQSLTQRVSLLGGTLFIGSGPS